MQEVTVLSGGFHYHHDAQGNPKDTYHINPDEQVQGLQCFVGHPLRILGHFPNVDLSSIIKEIKVRDNNIVACIEGPEGEEAKRKGRIAYLRSFAWERVSDEFLQEIADFFRKRGFDIIE